nr:hypothetical protein [Tanacetum cinerariifolium]
MTTLADKAILLGADNHLRMLKKDMYDSWKSIMELYIMNRQHGRMILEFVENGQLIWPMIKENGVTIPRKYSELTHAEAIQADCDVKETNIILQGLPPEVYELQGDDPIDDINHMTSFLSAFVISRYPTTNNQLRNWSNPRQQATINDGRVTLQPVQGRQISFATGTTRTYTPGTSESSSGKQRTVICYNCKKEGHMSKHCTKPKRKRDDSWFKDKMLLVHAQANGQILHDEELVFLADLGFPEDALAEVHNPDNIDNNMINLETLMLAEESRSKIILKQHDLMVLEKKNSINSSDPNLFKRPTKVEVPKELPKVSMEKGLIIEALRDELRKLKRKAIVENVVTSHTIAPEMLTIDVEPIAPKLLNNRTVHYDYLRHTQEQAAILREVVEQEKS